MKTVKQIRDEYYDNENKLSNKSIHDLKIYLTDSKSKGLCYADVG